MITLNSYYRKLMLRGLASAAAVNRREIGDYDELDAIRKILDSHPLDCRCAICMAYVEAPTPALGLMAAMGVRDKQLEAAVGQARLQEEQDADTPRGEGEVPKKLGHY